VQFVLILPRRSSIGHVGGRAIRNVQIRHLRKEEIASAGQDHGRYCAARRPFSIACAIAGVKSSGDNAPRLCAFPFQMTMRDHPCLSNPSAHFRFSLQDAFEHACVHVA